MRRLVKSRFFIIVTWAAVAGLLVLMFKAFFALLFHTWTSNEEFSYGILIPPIVGYLIWERYKLFKDARANGWNYGLVIAAIGCGLQVLASHSSTLLLSSTALTLILAGSAGFLWGKALVKLIAGPLALFIVMVPLPSYVVQELTWRLQVIASTVSANVLDLLGVPVFQDGNLLRLPNYVLEVKQACSGSRFIISLLALALVLGISQNEKWWRRGVLLMAAPLLAVVANVVRIVGTGLIARRWGNLVANESLHSGWGIAAFMFGMVGLVAIHQLLRRGRCSVA